MDVPSLLPNGWPAIADNQQEQALGLAEQARRTVAVAHGLLNAGRRVDLSGLERAVGLLCAKVLDLPVTQGRVARAALQDLLNEVDALDGALRSSAP